MKIFQKPKPLPPLPPKWRWMNNRWLLLIPQVLIIAMTVFYFTGTAFGLTPACEIPDPAIEAVLSSLPVPLDWMESARLFLSSFVPATVEGEC